MPSSAATPDKNLSPPATLVEHFFRHEAGRLHGALVRLLGVHNLTLAEDIAQEAMLRALRVWSMGGIPPNPAAWITQVAMNLGRDALRHQRMSTGKETAIVTHMEQVWANPIQAWAAAHEIRDDTLRLMFVCCHPTVAADSQVVLALKILCGFSTKEIAQAFFSSEAAIEKQLTRTKKKIQESAIGFEIPENENLAPRLDGVLRTLYLLFNEGYKASSGDRLLKDELCQEAIRLGSLLATHPAGNAPRTNALLALMLLNYARFPSRLDENGVLTRLHDQDRSKWDQKLIERGLSHLVRAAEGDRLSEYHLQAGIAACHCVATDYAATDWPRILQHYDALHQLMPTPIVALNRAVALANVHGAHAGIEAIAAIPDRERLESNHLFHAVLGELHLRLGDNATAAENFRRAHELAQVGPEQDHLVRMMEKSS